MNGPQWISEVKWDRDGLVPVIAQEIGSNDVLMFAFMNREALALTAERGQAIYWSRSRARLWHKGEASGHTQRVHEIRLDCDHDVVLLKVTQEGHEPGIACHTGRHSCFYQRLEGDAWHAVEPVLKDPQQIYDPATPPPVRAPGRSPAGPPAQGAQGAPSMPGVPDATGGRGAPLHDTLARLAAVIEARRAGDPDKSYVARLFHKGTDAMLKKIGEEATEVVMAAKDGARGALVGEVADLWFHSMIVLAQFGLRPADVLAELERREGQSGLEEFALRKVQSRENGET